MVQREKANFAKNSFNSIILDCLGCKWTILLMSQIARGINRPGELVRVIDGLSTKVLNQSLTRMIDYQILDKKSFAEVPPRVEYSLTPFGLELWQLLLKLESLQAKYFS